MNELEVKAALDSLALETTKAVDGKIADATKELATKSSIQELETKNAQLEAAAREQGAKLAEMERKSFMQGDAGKVSLAELLEKQMPEIEKVYNTKSGYTELDVKAAAVMTTANTIDNTTFSVPIGMIDSMNMLEFVGKRYGRQFITDIADVNTVAKIEEYTTWLEEGSFQGAFAIVAEGAIKPLVSTSLVRNFAKAQKIAGKYVVTEEFQKWRQNAYAIIRRIIMDQMIRDYSALIVTGINTAAAGYVGTTLDDQIVVPNDYDVIGAISAQISSLNFIPDVVILNPQDAWRIRLSKDSDNRYLFPTITEDGTTRIFSLRLIESTYQTAGYVTIGEQGLYKVEQEGITVRNGFGIDVTGSSPVTAVVSDFDNNRFRTIVEMFFKQWLPTPYIGSFVRAQFSVVKAALLKP